MYPHFIEITCELGDEKHRKIEKRLVNVDNIVVVSDNVIDCGKDGTWYAEESYDELKKLIEDIGYQIHKPDPRLDNKPLTIDNFKDLVGQPVYSINDNRWYIVHWFDIEEHDYKCAYLYSDEGVQVWWDAEKLIAKPLYRMKVSNGLVQ